MTTRLDSLVLDAADPEAIARWWGAALDCPVEVAAPDEVVVAVPDAPLWGDGGQPALVICRVAEAKSGKNRVHLDLASESPEQQAATVSRLLDLGARRVDVGQREVPWVVLADPDGNEFCVLDPRPDEPLGIPIGAVVLDCADPAGLAGFWSAASGWPVIAQGPGWARLAGPAGAPPLELLGVPDAKSVKNRLHLDVSPYPGDDHAAEVDRLIGLGARHVDVGQGDVSWVVLADPEGNEFCVLTPR